MVYSFCGIIPSLHSKDKRLVPNQRYVPLSSGTIFTKSDLSVGLPSSLSATTGSENCTCIEGNVTFAGSSPSGVKLSTLKLVFSSFWRAEDSVPSDCFLFLPQPNKDNVSAVPINKTPIIRNTFFMDFLLFLDITFNYTIQNIFPQQISLH